MDENEWIDGKINEWTTAEYMKEDDYWIFNIKDQNMNSYDFKSTVFRTDLF